MKYCPTAITLAAMTSIMFRSNARVLPPSMTLLMIAMAVAATDASRASYDDTSDGAPRPAATSSDDQPTAQRRDEPTAIRPFEDIVVYPDIRRVEIRAWTCLEAGYLEQIACAPGTREHESLVVIRAKPSNIHASLLLAGYESGRPGRWEFDPDTHEVTLIQPRGDKVDVWFKLKRDDTTVVESARAWIRDHHDKQTFPDSPWIFGGSMFRPNPEWMGPGEHYVADMTGSIIGLVTFGDETIGLKQVIADQAAVHEPEWMVHPDRVPPEGTEVTVIIMPFGTRPAELPPADEAEGESPHDPADKAEKSDPSTDADEGR
jgi:hypothetical protein